MSAASAVIRTAGGDIPAADLGPILLHEHVISSLVCYWEPDIAPEVGGVQVELATLSEVRRNPFAVRSNLILNDIDVAVGELRSFAEAGGTAVVDATSNGIGRDVRAIKYIASRSAVPIVLGSGYYIRASHPPGLSERTEASLSREMANEIQLEIEGTQVRAGVIGEIGVGSHPMHPVERRVLRAAARAQVETGAGLIAHVAPKAESAFEIARVLSRAGARMDKVLLCHLDERFRFSRSLFKRLAAFGCLFGFDTFGREIYRANRKRQNPSDADRIRMILELLDMGLADRITIGQDICLRHELTSFGGHGYGHVLRNVVPRLRDLGVSDGVIRQMLVTTPREFLSLPMES